MAQGRWLWVIYDRPKDFPTEVVAKLFFKHPSGELAKTEDTVRVGLSKGDIERERTYLYDAIKNQIEHHPNVQHRCATFTARMDGDDPSVVGTMS